MTAPRPALGPPHALAALLLAPLLAPPLAPEARADGAEVRMEKAQRVRKARVVRRPVGVALPAYALHPYCRHFAALGARGSERDLAVILCAQYEHEVRRDVAYRWHRLPVALRRACVLAAARPRDRAYTVLNGCLDERRLPGTPPPSDLPALSAGGGLLR